MLNALQTLNLKLFITTDKFYLMIFRNSCFNLYLLVVNWESLEGWEVTES